MRKKIAMLGLALAAIAGAYLSTPQAQAVGGTCAPRCKYYADGSKCCIPCWGTWPNCGCTNLACP